MNLIVCETEEQTSRLRAQLAHKNEWRVAYQGSIADLSGPQSKVIVVCRGVDLNRWFKGREERLIDLLKQRQITFGDDAVMLAL